MDKDRHYKCEIEQETYFSASTISSIHSRSRVDHTAMNISVWFVSTYNTPTYILKKINEPWHVISNNVVFWQV